MLRTEINKYFHSLMFTIKLLISIKNIIIKKNYLTAYNKRLIIICENVC